MEVVTLIQDEVLLMFTERSHFLLDQSMEILLFRYSGLLQFSTTLIRFGLDTIIHITLMFLCPSAIWLMRIYQKVVSVINRVFVL